MMPRCYPEMTIQKISVLEHHHQFLIRAQERVATNTKRNINRLIKEFIVDLNPIPSKWVPYWKPLFFLGGKWFLVFALSNPRGIR